MKRSDKHSCARIVMAAGLAAALVSAFGLPAVHAQTAGSTQPAGQPPVRRLSIDDAVATSLEQNLDLQVQRLNPVIRDTDMAVFRANYTPNFTSTVNVIDNTQPSSSALSGATGGLTVNRNTYDFGVGSLSKWGGATYAVNFSNARTTSNNIFTSFDPQLTSSVNVNYTQPLLRNFKIDGTRQQLFISQKNREISDVQLQQSIAQTVRNVKNAYYDLVYAIGNLGVQRQSLELAQQSLKDNRARVEIGTMAPLDIVQAEAEVATREESVIIAEAAIERTQDAVRALVYSPSSPDFWNARIEPTDTISFQPAAVDLDGAVRNALSQRTDLAVARKSLESTDVNIRYFRNQSMPDVNAAVNYSAQGIGGVLLQRGPGTGLQPGPILSTVERSFFSTLGTVFGGDFPGWTFSLDIAYPIGGSSNEASLARSRLQLQQDQKRISTLELQVAQQVREGARQVQTNAKRVDATRSSRALAEKRLEAEEKKYQAGMTQNFFVLQAQRDLNVARNSELLALVEYLKSVVNYQAVQVTP
ncbi:MAG: TolC family protein [Vicinamibacterales bacterium]